MSQVEVAVRSGSAVPSSNAVWSLVFDFVAPIALFYGIRSAGGSLWLALAAGGVCPVLSTIAGLVRHRRVDLTGMVMLAALTMSAAASLISGSPRALIARDGLVTAAWAGYMYLSLLGGRPVTFIFSRPLLEGRRVFDYASRTWVKPAAVSWDELWARSPRFRQIWRSCTVIWGTAIAADAAIRIAMAATLPVNAVPALGAALWPVTFVLLQVVTNVYFARGGLWRLLITGAGLARVSPPAPDVAS
jgi:hypothetical protein